jgi:hypothetical protein
LPGGPQSQLNGLGGGIAVDAADDLLDLHEVKSGLGEMAWDEKGQGSQQKAVK